MKLRTQCTAALLTIAISHPMFAQDSGGTGLRQRTDANAERDLQANRAYLREQAAQKARAEESANVSSANFNKPVEQPAVVRKSKIAPPNPPTYSGGPNVNTSSRSVKSLSPSFSWVPKNPQIDPTDVESMQRPSLQSKNAEIGQLASTRFEETSQPIYLANYQDAVIPPSLPYPGGAFGTQTPSGGFGSPSPSSQFNTQGNSVFPPQPLSVIPQGSVLPGTFGTSPTTIPNVANPANLPQYPQPQQRPAFTNTQPFVSGPPCDFDAYDMVTPASYYGPMQPCGPTAYPYSMPATTMGDAYVPPTITPNYAPGLYSSNNAGWRPLFSLGQENYNAQLGRGIIGQPTAYVPGQPFRNFFRYLAP